MIIADLHIHSRYSRATSRDLTPETLDFWARRKGLDILGTGDLTHPAWRAELREKLTLGENGLYTLREAFRATDRLPPGAPSPAFIPTGEISTIYKKNGRTRKVHHVVILPTLESAERFSKQLETRFNLHSDGRPILGLDSRDLFAILLDNDPDAMLIPAHIWTPHFSLFGAYSGFDTIEECYGDLSGQIHALETGLSSDPEMNWRLSALDRFAMVSHSDAHSPANLAREATLLELTPSYTALYQALNTAEHPGFSGTLEFFPEEGKYHHDGHRPCGAQCSPSETRAHGGVCPRCGGRITVGVLHRVEALADRPKGFVPVDAAAFERIVPLREVIANTQSKTTASKAVGAAYDAALQALGPELYILREAPLSDIRQACGVLLEEAVRRLRAGQLHIQPGYDGVYGKIEVLQKDEIAALSGQQRLIPEAFGLSATPAAQMPPAALKPAAKPETPPPHDGTLSTPSGLNSRQTKAVEAGEAVIAVIAGPGTGKTRTLIARILHLIENKQVPAERIAGVTFTNKAAKEMRERLQSELPDATTRTVQIGTFHALCLRLLQEHGESVSILSENDALALMEETLAGLCVEADAQELLQCLSRHKNGTASKETPPLMPEIAEAYQAKLSEYGAMDFDDILLRALALCQEGEAAPFAHLLVDEFQDINPLQYRLIRAWAKGAEGLFVIGDPNQAIYGFRGADPLCFDRLMTDAPDARRITLDENYRSTPQILRTAGVLAIGEPLKAKRPEGSKVSHWQADTPFSEALFITKEIGRLVGGVDMLSAHDALHTGSHSFSDIAVLYRTNRQAQHIEACFAQEGIPYQVTSRESFLSDPSARHAVSFLRLLLHPGDRFALRTCLKRDGGYAEESIAAMLTQEAPCASLTDLIALLRTHPIQSVLGRMPLAEMLAKYATLADRETPQALLSSWVQDQALEGVAAMEKLRHIAVMHRHLRGFIDTLTLGGEGDIARSAGLERAPESVSLMTLHAAKGLEFSVVFLCGVNEGLLPYQRRGLDSDPAEEARLFYVGLTRARDTLHLLSGGIPSPLLRQLPKDDLLSAPAFVQERAAGRQLSLFDSPKRR